MENKITNLRLGCLFNKALNKLMELDEKAAMEYVENNLTAAEQEYFGFPIEAEPFNIKRFEVGSEFATADLFTSEKMFYKIIDRDDENITFEVKQKVGDAYSCTKKNFPVYIDLDNESEYVIIWEFCGSKGYLYAAEPKNVWEE